MVEIKTCNQVVLSLAAAALLVGGIAHKRQIWFIRLASNLFFGCLRVCLDRLIPAVFIKSAYACES